MKAVPLRPHTTVFDAGDTHWRGGLVVAIDPGVSVTIRFLAEASLPKTAVVSAAMAGVRALGAPVAVRVTGVASNTHTVVEVQDGHYASPSDEPRDAAAAVALALAGQGAFYFGCVPRSITKESDTYDWRP